MKNKILLFSIMMSIFAVSINAQRTFTSMDNIVQLGIGGWSYLGAGDYNTTFPPISVSYEAGVIDMLFDENSSLGLGLFAGYTAGKQSLPVMWEEINSIDYKHNFFILSGNMNVHYQFIDKLDTYVGLSLGYNLSTSKYDGPDKGELIPDADNLGGFLWGLNVGARYYFMPSLAGFAEVGYGISPITIGLSMKF